jgi:hypothetical protein
MLQDQGFISFPSPFMNLPKYKRRIVMNAVHTATRKLYVQQ